MDFCLYFVVIIDFSFGFQDMVSKNFIKWIITTKYTLIIHPNLVPQEITLDSAVFHMFVVYGHVFLLYQFASLENDNNQFFGHISEKC